MHTSEDEAGFNHNHYRMKDCDADPKAIYDHLMGFVQAQRELKLVDAEGKEKFLDAKEAEEIYKKFEQFWIETRHVGPATTLELDGQKISLPAREVSLIDTFRSLPGQVLTPEDIAEWEANKSKQDPCISIGNWDSMTVKERLSAVAGGMRGLGAELAQTRQMEGSKYATQRTVVAKSDAVVIA
jgi:hypothetical protein